MVNSLILSLTLAKIQCFILCICALHTKYFFFHNKIPHKYHPLGSNISPVENACSKIIEIQVLIAEQQYIDNSTSLEQF